MHAFDARISGLGALDVGIRRRGIGTAACSRHFGNHYVCWADSCSDLRERVPLHTPTWVSLAMGCGRVPYRDDIGLYTAPDSTQFRVIRLGAAHSRHPFNRFREHEFGLDFQTGPIRVS